MLDDDETDRGGIEMNANARVQLMAKLASGNEMRAKQQAAAGDKDGGLGDKVREMFGAPVSTPGPMMSECFVLSNMFNPATETDPYWAQEIRYFNYSAQKNKWNF